YDADGFDVFAHARNARNQATDTAYQQSDFHAGVACVVEFVDHRPIGEAIHLEIDVRLLPCPGIVDFAIDEFEELAPRAMWRDDQVFVAVDAVVDIEEIENLDDVFENLLMASKQRDIGVNAGTGFVEVTG